MPSTSRSSSPRAPRRSPPTACADRAERPEADLPRTGLGQAARSDRGRARRDARGPLEDLQGRFNLNNLVRQYGTPDPVQLDRVHSSCWRCSGSSPNGPATWSTGSTATSFPRVPRTAPRTASTWARPPPYRTPNRYITSASELLALPGFGRDRYVTLCPLRDRAPLRHNHQRLHRLGRRARCLPRARAHRLQFRPGRPRQESRRPPPAASRRSPTSRRL